MNKNLMTMAIAVALSLGMAQARTVKHNLENPQVKGFYDQVTYPDDDYSYSEIKKYNQKMPYRLDQPWPYTIYFDEPKAAEKIRIQVWEGKQAGKPLQDYEIDGHTSAVQLWNLTPGRTYTYLVSIGSKAIKTGKLQTEGRRRMIYAPSVHNFRDLGGLPIPGAKGIKYGKIYRGGQLTYKGEKDKADQVITQVSKEDVKLMHDDLGIRGEIDFRFDPELGLNDTIPGNDINFTPLGSDATYYNIQVHTGGQFDMDRLHGKVLKTVLYHLRRGEAVYVHCVAGADRTGMMCLLMEGLLGVPESELLKDYELTTFSIYGHRHRDGYDMTHGIPKVKAFQGNTLQQKIENLFLSEGVTPQEIAEFKEIMIEK